MFLSRQMLRDQQEESDSVGIELSIEFYVLKEISVCFIVKICSVIKSLIPPKFFKENYKKNWNYYESISVKIRYDHQNRGHSQKIDFAYTFYIDRPLHQVTKIGLVCCNIYFFWE